jgi:DNA-binding transcriptional regulator YdaS (Cro superfamily)
MSSTGLQLALSAIEGNQSELARICGVAQPTVWGWINKGRGVLPAEYVLAVEKATGVSRHDLRPDLYPREDEAA